MSMKMARIQRYWSSVKNVVRMMQMSLNKFCQNSFREWILAAGSLQMALVSNNVRITTKEMVTKTTKLIIPNTEWRICSSFQHLTVLKTL